jgi:hypothetical protein
MNCNFNIIDMNKKKTVLFDYLILVAKTQKILQNILVSIINYSEYIQSYG